MGQLSPVGSGPTGRTVGVALGLVVALATAAAVAVSQGIVPVPGTLSGLTIPVTPSVGCGVAPAITPTHLSQVNLTYPVTPVAPYTSTATARDYQLYLPDGYNPHVPYPLVVALHYYGGSGLGFEQLLRLDDVADRLHVIVAFPDGTLGAAGTSQAGVRGWETLNPPEWASADGAGYAGVDDVGFISKVVTQIATGYCVNTADESAFGFSLGGSMTYQLACAGATWMRAIGVIESSNPHEVSFTGSGCNNRHIGLLQMTGVTDTNAGQINGLDGTASAAFTSLADWTGATVQDTWGHTATTLGVSFFPPYVAKAGSWGPGDGCTAVTEPYSNTQVFEQVFSGCSTPVAATGPNDSAAINDPLGGHAIMGGWANAPAPNINYGCSNPENTSGALLFANRATCQISAADVMLRFLTTGSTTLDPAATPVSAVATPQH